MTQAIVTQQQADIMEQVIIKGDLSQLTPQERVNYYRTVCQSIGLNPLTKPFDYINLNGKLTLYAKKDAADQLRAVNGVSISKPDITFQDDLIIVTVAARDKTGREDSDIGVVRKTDMRGDVANALMKAVTKAKRRVTLSLCGLGWLDETEVETIPDARPVAVDVETGVVITKSAPIEQKQVKAAEHDAELEARIMSDAPSDELIVPEQPKAPAKKCTVKTANWVSMLTRLQQKTTYYNGKDGAVNGYHATGAAAKCGYTEVTDENLELVYKDLLQYAIEQTTELPA